MVTGTVFDLEINKYVFDYANPFGLFMEEIGELPGHCIEFFGFAVLLASYRNLDDTVDIARNYLPFTDALRSGGVSRKFMWLFHKIIYALFIWGVIGGADDFIGFLCKKTAGAKFEDLMMNIGFNETAAFILWTAARILASALAVFLFTRVSRHRLKSLEILAATGIFLYFASVAVDMLKDVFTRVRFREMIAYSHGLIGEDGKTDRGSAVLLKEWIKDTDFSAFTPWYKKGDSNGIYSSCTSFPSGHTKNAAYSLLLFFYAENRKKFIAPAFAIGFGYTGAMAFSRLLRGAHYLTDVAAAAIIMFTFCLLIYIALTLIDERAPKLKTDTIPVFGFRS